MPTNYGPLKIIKGNIEYQRGAIVSRKAEAMHEKEYLKKNGWYSLYKESWKRIRGLSWVEVIKMSNDNILHKWWKGSKYEDGVKSMHKGLDAPREKITKMYNKMFGKVK